MLNDYREYFSLLKNILVSSRFSLQILTLQRPALNSPWQRFRLRYISKNNFPEYFWKCHLSRLWMTCTTQCEVHWRTETRYFVRSLALTPSPFFWQSVMKQPPIIGKNVRSLFLNSIIHYCPLSQRKGYFLERQCG